MLKITRVLYAAIREAERNMEVQQKNILNLQFNFNANYNNEVEEEFAADSVIASIQVAFESSSAYARPSAEVT